MALRDWIARLLGRRAPPEAPPLPTQRAHRETVRRALRDVHETTLEIRRRVDEERETLHTLRETR